MALFLLWIFIFPLMYQTAHRINHLYAKEYDNCCKVNELHNIRCDIAHLHPNSVIGKEEHCPICEYSFYVNNFAERFAPYFDLTENHFSYTEAVSELFKPKTLSHKTPRAPPVDIS